MKRIDRVKTAVRNLHAGKQSAVRIIIGITCLMVFILSYVLVVGAFSEYRDTQEGGKINACYRYRSIMPGTGLDELEEKCKEIIDKNTDSSQTGTSVLISVEEKGWYQSQPFSKNLAEEEMWASVAMLARKYDGCYTSGDTVLEVEGKECVAEVYTGIAQEIYQDLKGKDSTLRIGLYDPTYQIYPDWRETGKTGDDIIGNLPKQPGEILLDEYLISVFQITDNPEDLPGKTITLRRVSSGEAVLEKYHISGIVRTEALNRREKGNNDDPHTEHIWAWLKDEDKAGFEVESGTVRFYYPSYRAMTESIRDFGALIRNHGDSETIISEGGALTEAGTEICIFGWLLSRAQNLLLILGGAAVFATICATGYLWSFYRSRNRKYYDMLDAIGMRRADRKSIFRFEILIMIAAGTLISGYFMVLFWFVFQYVVKNAMNYTPRFPAVTFSVTMAGIWIAVYLLSVPFSNIKTGQIRDE